MELRHAVLAVLREGHDISTSEVSLTCERANFFLVEVYDPLDVETQEPLDPTWTRSSLYKLMGRVGDFVQRAFDTPHEAVDFYLALIEETRQ